MFKLGLEKAEEPEIQKKKKKKSASGFTKAFDCVDHNKLKSS